MIGEVLYDLGRLSMGELADAFSAAAWKVEICQDGSGWAACATTLRGVFVASGRRPSEALAAAIERAARQTPVDADAPPS